MERGSKRFIDFKTCYILFSLRTSLPTQLALLEMLAYSSNKRVIYAPEPNSNTVHYLALKTKQRKFGKLNGEVDHIDDYG